MRHCYSECNCAVKDFVAPGETIIFCIILEWLMPKKPKTLRPKKITHRHYIREWRRRRGLSLRKLAARCELEPGGEEIISYASISRIEKYQQDFTETTLNALADALDVKPWMLLEMNPFAEGEVVDLLIHLDPKKREMALEYLRFLKS